MPTTVEIKDRGVSIDFPDSMSQDDIQGVLRRKFGRQQTQTGSAPVVNPDVTPDNYVSSDEERAPAAIAPPSFTPEQQQEWASRRKELDTLPEGSSGDFSQLDPKLFEEPTHVEDAAIDLANRPMINIGPAAAEEMRKATLRDPNRKRAAIETGITGSVGDMASFFTSPLGIATLGMGALPKLTQRVIALAFAGQMAKDVPGMATELGNELGKPEAERDYKKIAQLTTSGIAQTAFTVGGAMHGAGHPLIEATGAVPLMKAAETIKPVAPLTAAALEQQAGSTISKKVEVEFNPEPSKAPEVPPVEAGLTATIPETPTAPEKGAENAEAIRGDQGQLPPSGETAVTGEEAGGHDIQPSPPEQPESVESGKAEEVAPTEESVTEASQRAGETTAPLTAEERAFGESVAKKHGSPVSPLNAATDPLEELFRFSNQLERGADKSRDASELSQILSAANGKPHEGRIAWAIANNPHSTDETFAQAKANSALRSMTTDENIARLDDRRAELRKSLGLSAAEAAPQQPTAAEPQSAEQEYDKSLADFKEASKKFTAAQKAYRTRKIGDEEFLNAKADFNKAMGVADAAERKFIEQKNAPAEQPFNEPQSAVPEPTESLSKEASPSESVPEAGAPPVPESPSVEAAPKTDLGAAPAEKPTKQDYSDWQNRPQLMVRVGGSHRLIKRQYDAFKNAGVPIRSGGAYTLGGKAQSAFIPDSAEAIALLKEVGGTISRGKQFEHLKKGEPYKETTDSKGRSAERQKFLDEMHAKIKEATTKEGMLPKPTETPATAAAKVEAEVKQVAATEGQRPAKEVKSELVARIEDEIKAVVDKKGWTVNQNKEYPQRWELKATDGDSIAVDIEKTKSGYSGTVYGVSGGKKTITGKTVEEIISDSKALGSSQSGTVTIDIPGDGEFTVPRNGGSLVELRDRAARISTSKGGSTAASSSHAVTEAEPVIGAYGGAEAAYKSVQRQIKALQDQGPPSTAAEREDWNRQISGANRMLSDIYDKTKAAALEAKADNARTTAATYREGAKGFRESIAKIEKVKKQTKAHKERLEDLEERYAENQKRLMEYERNAEQFEQEAAKEKAALEATEPPKETVAAESPTPRPVEPRLSTSNVAKSVEEKSFRATAEGQKAMASRASRIALLNQLNEGIRRIDPNEAYDRSLIEGIPDSQIDKWRDDLTAAWNRLKGAEPKIIGMGGAIPEEFARGQGSATSIKNATVDSERAKRGLPPAMEPARRSFGQVWDQAMAAVDRDPKVVDALIESLQKKPRALTDFEDALLLHRQLDLHHEYDRATRDLAQAYEDAKQFPEREAQAVEEKLRVARLSDELQSLYDLGKKVGTETGRGLNARKMMAHEDFTLAKMELESRAARGGRQLTDAERAEITALHDKIAESQKRYDEYVSQSQDRISKLEAQAAIDKLKVEAAKEGPAIHPKIIEIAEKLVKQLDARADAARARIKARMGKFNAGVDPTVLLDVADIGASYLGHKVLDSVKWADKMVGELGEWIRPHLDEIRKASEKRVNDLADKSGRAVEVKKALTGLPVEEQAKAIAEKIKEKKDKGKLDEITWYVQRLARIFVQGGIKDREALIDKVHEAIAKVIPEQTRRQAMDMISGYGDYRQLSKDKISVELRGMKGEMQQLAKLEDMAKGKPPLKSGVERRSPTDAERKLIKEVNEAKLKFQVPVEDPETQLKSALDTLKTTLSNRIKDYQDRISRGDFTTRPRRQIVLDAEASRLKAENERVKKQFQRGVAMEKLKARGKVERTGDWIVKWRRGFILSGPVTLAKLTAAAAQRMSFTPVEEAIGGAYSKALPGLAERAPREGGFNVKAEAQAITQGLTKGIADAWQVLKTGQSDLDVLYGKEALVPPSVADFFGHIHGALKAPTKRAEFARSLEKRTQQAIAAGVDVSDPLVQSKMIIESYKDANRSIFQQDNRVVSAWKRGMNALEQKDKATGQVPVAGKVASTVAKVLFPIVKIPTNIVAETMQYATGLVTGSTRLARAYHAGIENVKPEEADLIMRQLKKGSIGAAALLLGYFNADVIGGYYQQGQKRDQRDVKPGHIRLFGHEIPSFLLHNPLLETLQVGATIRRVADSKLKKSDKETQGIPEGIWAAALGLAEEVPFVGETLGRLPKILNPHERGQFLGELAKSLIVPQVLQWAAQHYDTNAQGEQIQRKPTTALEHIKSGIPGLRQTVPKKK